MFLNKKVRVWDLKLPPNQRFMEKLSIGTKASLQSHVLKGTKNIGTGDPFHILSSRNYYYFFDLYFQGRCSSYTIKRSLELVILRGGYCSNKTFWGGEFVALFLEGGG